MVTSPKTSSSYRTIPIPKFFLKDLSDLYTLKNYISKFAFTFSDNDNMFFAFSNNC